MYHDYGPKVKSLLPDITYGKLDKLEEVLKDKALLNEYNDEVRAHRGHNETLLSALIYKLKDAQLQYKICCLFLRHGLSFSTIVFKNLNILIFFCSLNKFSFVQIKIICLCIFAFKNEISFSSVLEECSQENQRRLKKFFVNEQGNFSVDTVDFLFAISDMSYASLIESFVDASVILNKNAVTDGLGSCDIVFSLLNKLMKSLCNMRRGFFNIKRKGVLLNILETLLLTAIHPNSYEKQNKFKRKIYSTRFVFFFRM